MSEKNRNKISITIALASACVAFASVCILLSAGDGSVEASASASAEPWICPIDSNLPEAACRKIMADDPGYMGYCQMLCLNASA